MTISLDSDRTALGVWRTTSNPNGLKWCAMLCLNSITTTLRILRSPCPCKAAVGNVGSPAPSQSVGEGVASWAGDSPLTLSVGGGGAPRGLGLGQPRGLGLGPPIPEIGAGGRKTANVSSGCVTADGTSGLKAIVCAAAGEAGAGTSGVTTAGGASGPK